MNSLRDIRGTLIAKAAWVIAAAASVLICACATEPKTGCNDRDDCFVGNVCIEGTCVAPADFACGNERKEPGETCDGDCPTGCNDDDSCTVDSLVGSAAGCDATCMHVTITSCEGGDGCCPADCRSTTDADCSSTGPTPCSNKARDGDETDVDCGGTSCDRCPAGRSCNSGSDCASGSCEDKVCLMAGDCTVPGSVHLTIQEAINDPTCAVVRIKPGRYTESLQIPRALELVGSGVDQTTLDGQNEHRVIEASGSAEGTLIIRELTITSGRAEQGGAVRSLRALSCDTVTFIGNVATALSVDGTAEASGGAVYIEGADLDVVNCRFEGNRAEVKFAADLTRATVSGGAIAGIDATLTVRKTQFRENSAVAEVRSSSHPTQHTTARGGAVASARWPAACERCRFIECQFRSNSARASAYGDATAEGGALHGATTVESSVFEDNLVSAQSFVGASAGGGGAARLGTVDGTVFQDNRVFASGGDIVRAEGGAAYVVASLLNSLVRKNLASGDLSNPALALHLWVTGGGVTYAGQIINSTISANRVETSEVAASADAEGGGVRGADLILSSTIVGNYAAHSGGGVSDVRVIGHTVLANNVAPEGPDCFYGLSTSARRSLGSNLVETTDDCLLDFDQTDIRGVDPLLSDLADNGGPTRTHLPQAGSPLINGGDPKGCTDAEDAPLAADQRGELRTGACDIGAVEVE